MAIFAATNVAMCLVMERLKRIRWVEAVSAVQTEELALLDLGRILSLDADQRITRWSEGCRRLYGFDAKEVRWSDHRRAACKSQAPNPSSRSGAELLERGRWEGELTRRHKNGTELIVTIPGRYVDTPGESLWPFSR